PAASRTSAGGSSEVRDPIGRRRRTGSLRSVITARFDPGELAGDWAGALERLAADRVVERLFDGDHTVIQDDPTECADRLGWLTAPEDAAREWPRWSLLADAVGEGSAAQDAGRVLQAHVLRMGRSSLVHEVLPRALRHRAG